MRIALAQVPHPTSFTEGLEAVRRAIGAAAAAGAELVCFPECCLKGMRGTDFPVEALTRQEHDLALADVREQAAAHRVHVLLPTERPHEGAWQNGAYLVQADGVVQGYQAKNQLPLEEEPFFTPGTMRRLFRIDGLLLGVVICHEGWRYPETVRWAARRGAQIVFHPQFHEAELGGYQPSRFADPANTFHEKAALCRAAENTCFFATVNYASIGSPTTSAVVRPDGTLLSYQPYGKQGLLIADIDLAEATRLLAKRCKSFE
jgi:predicted amidohydrolase